MSAVLAYVGWVAARPARSAPVALSVTTPTHRHVRKPQPAARRALAARARRPQRKRRSSRVAPRRARPYRLAVFGDSVTVGYGSSGPGHGYVGRISRWLRKHGERVVTTVHGKGGVPVAYWLDARMPKRLDAAVVELGTNDVRLGTSPARFAWEYRTLTRRIRAASPGVRILCLSVWSHPEAARSDVVVNARIRAACPGTYVDITSLRRRRWIRSNDGFHPNNTGYRLIAQAVESKLKRRRR